MSLNCWINGLVHVWLIEFIFDIRRYVRCFLFVNDYFQTGLFNHNILSKHLFWHLTKQDGGQNKAVTEVTESATCRVVGDFDEGILLVISDSR